jgi:hypothetical protein
MRELLHVYIIYYVPQTYVLSVETAGHFETSETFADYNTSNYRGL